MEFLKKPTFVGYWPTLALSFFLIIIDQLSKWYAAINFREPLILIEDFFQLIYRTNSGIAFSIPLPSWLILISNVILIVIGLRLAIKYLDFKFVKTQILVALILGGALSNILDRLRFGEVIDFISIYRYPVFNLADSFITVGVILLIFYHAKLASK